MMRAPGCMSVAVRKPDGSIAITEGPMQSKLAKSGVLKWPGVRGIVTLFESMSLGYRALNFSAEQQLTEEEKAELGEGSGGWTTTLSMLLPPAPDGDQGLMITMPIEGAE